MSVPLNVSQHPFVSVEIQCCHERRMQKQIISLGLDWLWVLPVHFWRARVSFVDDSDRRDQAMFVFLGPVSDQLTGRCVFRMQRLSD